jgi:hypothetical protein
MVELAVEDEDVAIDLGVETGAPDLMRLKCCIAFRENGDRPQRPRLPHGFNRAGIEVLLIREAHHDIGKGEA